MLTADFIASRKQKVCLQDYDYQHDIESRLLLSQFSIKELEVLEEILYSSILIPIPKLCTSLELEEEDLTQILTKIEETGLFRIEAGQILVDKEMRKYFESQIVKFGPDFKPGMEFLQGLMRKVPIHVLPSWYAIPRASDNIFDSLVEKYLLTPAIFHRHLEEIFSHEPLLGAIVQDVYASPSLSLLGREVMEKHHLSREQFEEVLLSLEFQFALCLSYTKTEGIWEEMVTPFQEWKEHLAFLRETQPVPITTTDQIIRKRPSDFAFLEDVHHLLTLVRKYPLPIYPSLPEKEDLALIAKKMGYQAEDLSFSQYLEKMVRKVRAVRLVDVVEGRLYVLDTANEWLEMEIEEKAIFFHRHPLNHLEEPHLPPHLCTERALREAEKSIVRVLNSGWVYFDDFVRSVTAALAEGSAVMLKKQGKHWRYERPHYGPEEIALLHTTILEWLFEIGITAVGTHNGRECFSVTPFGQSLFGE